MKQKPMNWCKISSIYLVINGFLGASIFAVAIAGYCGDLPKLLCSDLLFIAALHGHRAIWIRKHDAGKTRVTNSFGAFSMENVTFFAFVAIVGITFYQEYISVAPVDKSIRLWVSSLITFAPLVSLINGDASRLVAFPTKKSTTPTPSGELIVWPRWKPNKEYKLFRIFSNDERV